jgi:hypothetical protein
MMSEAPGWKDRLQRLLQTARLSSRLPGVDLAGAQDGFWGWCHLALLRLVAKPSHVRVDVDELAYRLRYPMNYG